VSENRRILRDSIYLAHEGGYGGPGSDWDSASKQELDRVLEAKEHLAVLRSEEFGRAFFVHILSSSAVAPGAEPSFVDPEELELVEARAEVLCEELARSSDPLSFLKQYLT
jgi:hypothetical protein